MRVKNVSRKVIGNQEFRLLPGESMEVERDALWVQMYLSEGKLIEVEAEKLQQETGGEQIQAEDNADADEEKAKNQTENVKASAESDEGADTTVEGRKKGGRKKSEAAE